MNILKSEKIQLNDEQPQCAGRLNDQTRYTKTRNSKQIINRQSIFNTHNPMNMQQVSKEENGELRIHAVEKNVR